MKAHTGQVAISVKRPALSFLSLAIIIFMLTVIPLAFAADNAIDTATGSSTLELVRDWRVLAALAMMFSVVLVAIAYMLGQAFEMPEIKAWAQAEMSQVFVTAIIIISFAGTALLLDLMLEQIVQSSGLGFTCSGSANCAVNVSEEYLGGLIDSCLKQARENMVEASSAARTGNLRFGLSTPVLIPMLQASTSFTFTASKLMDYERRSVVVEYLGNILSSLYSQEFFVSEISFKLAPVILAIGIVARSFFPTRKLGGLLIAVGIGVMYVFPLMFVFDWLTLNITLFGASSIEPPLSACPAACLFPPPRFYSETGQQFFSQDDLRTYLSDKGVYGVEVNESIDVMDTGLVPSAAFGVEQVYSCQKFECRYKSSDGTEIYSIHQLRTYLAGKGVSGDVIDQAVTDLEGGMATPYSAGGETIDRCEVTGCPSTCRDLPYSSAPECQTEDAVAACSQMDVHCKMTRFVNPDQGSEDIYSDGIMDNGECPTKCRSVPPLKADCSANNCMNGSNFCRFARAPDMVRPTSCYADGDRPADQSMSCPANMTANQSCVWVLPSKEIIDSHDCDSCNFVPMEYTYSPPVYLACTDLCNPSPTGPPKISPAEFARRSMEGMVGKEEIKAVSALMLPAYVLPILNILVTLIFIRSFSQIIGGDMDIPGLMKIL
jgi:hypothetical protein